MGGLIDSGDISSGKDYQSLEKHILNTERDNDNEKWVSIRLEKWQVNLAEIIGSELLTSKTEVYERSVKRGLKEFRELPEEKIRDVRKLRVKIFQAISSVDHDQKKIMEANDKLHGLKIDKRTKINDDSKLDEVVGIPVQESIYSEVKDQIIDNFGFSQNIYRVFVSMGLKDSDNCPETYISSVEGLIDDYVDSVEQIRYEMESFFLEHLKDNFFRLDRLDDKAEYGDEFYEVTEYMETEKKQEAEEIVNEIFGDKDG